MCSNGKRDASGLKEPREKLGGVSSGYKHEKPTFRKDRNDRILSTPTR